MYVDDGHERVIAGTRRSGWIVAAIVKAVKVIAHLTADQPLVRNIALRLPYNYSFRVQALAGIGVNEALSALEQNAKYLDAVYLWFVEAQELMATHEVQNNTPAQENPAAPVNEQLPAASTEPAPAGRDDFWYPYLE